MATFTMSLATVRSVTEVKPVGEVGVTGSATPVDPVSGPGPGVAQAPSSSMLHSINGRINGRSTDLDACQNDEWHERADDLAIDIARDLVIDMFSLLEQYSALVILFHNSTSFWPDNSSR